MVWRDLTSPGVMQTVVQSDEHRRLIEEASYQSAAVAPLVARGSTLGALSFLHASTDLRYDDEDLQLLGELADRAALALDNARLYEERDRIAQNLQRGLRPPEPPYVAGPRHLRRLRPLRRGDGDRRRPLRHPPHRRTAAGS